MNNPNISSYARLCSKSIRSSFLDYFCNTQGHTLVKSSPIVPYGDDSIAFVNSGMCQFKNVFLGLTPAPYPRVANSQKCIRVGGKHNDLSCAGRDSYHHTFFEMLGNWSFNDYYKRDACRMALEFLTKPPVSLPLDRLYFTYFGGSDQYGLPCDEETREIWLELGVPRDHIKKEGMKCNFWEMGSTGPCGYSSEIHYDIKGEPSSALARVNADRNDLIEIWNIVFISHKRVSADTIVPLSKNYIDTGLGFERLVTILQNKTSTYDTDLFLPLLETIEKVSGAKPYGRTFTTSNRTDLDTSYRMLSDYSRMITVALADNMFPDATAKLRNVVRDALLISEDVFKVKQGKLVKELSYNIAEILGDVYPEIQDSINKIQLILGEESRIFDNLRKAAVKEWKPLVKTQPELEQFNIMEEPGLVLGVKYLTKQLARDPSITEISGDMAFTLYDTYGLSKNIIQELAAAKKLTLCHEAFEQKLNELKERSKAKAASNIPDIDLMDLKHFPVTDDKYKYDYHYDTNSKRYTFPRLDTNLVGIVIGDQVFCIDKHAIRHAHSGASIDSIQLEHNAWVGLIFDKTNLYATAGGQIDDIGVAYLTNTTQENGKVEIGELASLEGKIVHFGNVVSSFKVTPGLTSRVEVDARMRLGCMRAHTTSHLLNAALRRVLTCTYQKSCRVFSDECALDFSVYGETLSVDSVAAVEKYINDVIADQVQVDRRHMRASELPSLTHLTVIPGEIYPDDVILIDISDKENVISREPCCGTHVFNTGHIESCTVIGYKSYNHGVRSIKCLTGDSSKAAVENGKQLSAAVKQLEATINQNSEQTDEETLNQQNHEIKTLRELLEDDLPYAVHKQNDHLLAELSKNVKLKLRQFAKVRITEELIERCKEDTLYLVHYIRDDAVEIQALPPLSQISKPVLVLLYSLGELKARAYVPPQCTTPGFNAQAWLTPIMDRAEGKGVSSKGSDVQHLYSMNPVKISNNVEDLVKQLVDIARRSADELRSNEKQEHKRV